MSTTCIHRPGTTTIRRGESIVDSDAPVRQLQALNASLTCRHGTCARRWRGRMKRMSGRVVCAGGWLAGGWLAGRLAGWAAGQAVSERHDRSPHPCTGGGHRSGSSHQKAPTVDTSGLVGRPFNAHDLLWQWIGVNSVYTIEPRTRSLSLQEGWETDSRPPFRWLYWPGSVEAMVVIAVLGQYVSFAGQGHCLSDENNDQLLAACNATLAPTLAFSN